MIIGAHMPKTNGFAAAAKQSHDELGANALQVFMKSPRGGASKPLDPKDAEQFKANCKEYDIKFLVAHASYLVNLAKPQPKDGYGIESLREDLEKLGALGGGGLVYHTGKTLDQEYGDAREILVENLKVLLDKIEPYGVPLLLENAAGQGTEMAQKMEELGIILVMLGNHELIKVCIDTCHAFAAGYDIRTEQGVTDFFKEFDKHIGIKNLTCIHLNDSQFDLGSNKDRHANLGEGKIGQAGITAVIKQANKHKIPIILETPLVNNSHKIDIDRVKEWAS